MNVNKNILSKSLKVGKTLGKAILWEGVKGVLLKSTVNVITTSFDKGLNGVKKMTLEDYVGSNKKIVIPDIKEVDVDKTTPKETRVIIDGEFDVVEGQKQN